VTRIRSAAARPLEVEELLELTCGSPPRWAEPSAFASEEERRATWEAHRDEFAGMNGFPGNRCWAYWHYELGIERPEDREEAILLLAKRGDLEPRELRLVAEESVALYERVVEARGG
jgi:hypothetical protein